ncbi:hypothetical protein TYRP_023458 [Tyrophagus putrescentiae]|nr:hypothetical protein TYRP_023458 [Tyrophagus putrescentiae]
MPKCLKQLGTRSLRSRGPSRRAFLVSQVTPDLAVFICAPMNGPAAHPDVTWLLSTPSSSGLARCARETLVVRR